MRNVKTMLILITDLKKKKRKNMTGVVAAMHEDKNSTSGEGERAAQRSARSS